MGFEVDPDDLEAFSRQLGRASGDVRSALDYMQKECTIGPFDRGPLSEIASMFKSGHEEVFSSTKSTLEKLQKILDSSKREMSQSAKYYANTDRSEASRVDATYPAASGGASERGIPGRGAEAGKSTFHDVAQPTERLVPPTVDSEADEPTGLS